MSCALACTLAVGEALAQTALKPKTTTEIPPGIAIPGDVETRLAAGYRVKHASGDDRAQGRQDAARDISDDWHGGYGDHWDGYYGGGYWGAAAVGAAAAFTAYAIGTTITASAYTSLGCTPTTVVVGGVTYSQCGGAWYQPTYAAGGTTYVVVEAPEGY